MKAIITTIVTVIDQYGKILDSLVTNTKDIDIKDGDEDDSECICD